MAEEQTGDMDLTAAAESVRAAAGAFDEAAEALTELQADLSQVRTLRAATIDDFRQRLTTGIDDLGASIRQVAGSLNNFSAQAWPEGLSQPGDWSEVVRNGHEAVIQAGSDASNALDNAREQFAEQSDSAVEALTRAMDGVEAKGQEAVDALADELSAAMNAFDDLKSSVEEETDVLSIELNEALDAFAARVRVPILEFYDEFEMTTLGIGTNTVVTTSSRLVDKGQQAEAEVRQHVTAALDRFDAQVEGIVATLTGAEADSAEQNRVLEQITREVKELFDDTLGKIEPVKSIAGTVGFSL